MAGVEARLIFTQKATKQIGSVVVDAFLSENHSFTSTVSRFPIEDGSKISDHVIDNLNKLAVNSIIGSSDILNRPLSVFQELERLKNEKSPVTVVTGLKVYENMIITRFQVPRDRTNGASLVFNMTLEQIIIVNSQSTIIPKTQLGGDTTTQQQSQAPVDIGKTTSGQTQPVGIVNQIQNNSGGILALMGV